MMAFVSATEPLRIANRIAGQALFRSYVISVDGVSATGSNGMRLLADYGVADHMTLPSLAVCSGFLPQETPPPAVTRWLMELDRAGCVLGGLDTGCIWLAAAGLMDDARVTLHWESLPSFRERFPAIDAVESLYEISARRFSCAGGAAAMSLTLEMIARSHGRTLAAAVSEQLIHDQARAADSGQRQSLAKRLSTHHPAVVKAAALMETNIEEPLTMPAIARQVGVSPRQMQRLFSDELGATPNAWYLQLRLARARQFIIDTALTLTEVMIACGFNSQATFSRAYRSAYGRTPSAERKNSKSH
ncbi:GlxA family transcriptional regulator [Salinisphaera sp. USBA-960]|nr:GlxA family transcriptional regulator [Salifodinibacter halophilus]NNC25723.1 GlxA family transcriptional regulator [Salifodinibacter halophilus]